MIFRNLFCVNFLSDIIIFLLVSNSLFMVFLRFSLVLISVMKTFAIGLNGRLLLLVC